MALNSTDGGLIDLLEKYAQNTDLTPALDTVKEHIVEHFNEHPVSIKDISRTCFPCSDIIIRDALEKHQIATVQAIIHFRLVDVDTTYINCDENITIRSAINQNLFGWKASEWIETRKLLPPKRRSINFL